MPSICMFYGILINMFFHDAGEHSLSHLHADATPPVSACQYHTKHDENWFGRHSFSVYSNYGKLFLRAVKPRYAWELKTEYDYDAEYEFESLYERLFTRRFSVYLGVDAEREQGEAEATATLGSRYILPFEITADARLESEGEARLQLRGNLPLSERMEFGWKWGTDGEYEVEAEYEINERWLLNVNHGAPFETGAGIKLKF